MKKNTNLYTEPSFHFFKKGHWLNDPNGLVYYNNQYHMFYQMNPDGIVWGNMHWGHASSHDCLHWTHHPIALHAEPDGLGYIFSGGGVVDYNNTSSLKENEHAPVILSFTHHDKNAIQRQSIAYSIDGMETFQKYTNNPVIENPGKKDFRDPKIIWVNDISAWVMTIVAGKEVEFYRSDNLKDWDYLSSFGEALGCQDGVWECPDLFPLRCKTTNQMKWILLISINPGGPNGGSGMQFFIGDFVDGQFMCVAPKTCWLDYGTDFYAAISFDNLNFEDKKRRVIAWMSNWEYANETPCSTYRSAMTLPRDIHLTHTGSEHMLAMKFIPEVDTLRLEAQGDWRKDGHTLTKVISNNYECVLKIDKQKLLKNSLILEFSNESAESLPITFDFSSNKILFDRTKCKWDQKGFARQIWAPITWSDNSDSFDLRIIVDNCSFEIAVNHGLTNISSLVFPKTRFDRVNIVYPEIEAIRVEDFTLKSIW